MADTGEVSFDGEKECARPRASERHVGFVFQHYAAVPPHDGV